MKLRCKLGFHKWVPVDFKNKNYKDSKHGWLEGEKCELCGYRTAIREYY